MEKLLGLIDASLTGDDRVPLQWLIVSPLAKGADRIVARAVLDRPESRLQVITPFSVDEYRKDFDTAEDLAEFDELLVGDPAPTMLNREVRPKDEAARNRGYLDVGEAIVQACELLIAVWDGKEAGDVGGTGDIVRYALEAGRTVIWLPSDDPSSGAKLLLPAARHGFRARRDLPPHHVASLPASAKRLSLGYHQLASFLRDNQASDARFSKVACVEKKRLTKRAGAAKLTDAQIEILLDKLLPFYVRAEVLAQAYQGKHFKATRAIYYLSAIAVSCLVFQVLHLPEGTHWAGWLGVLSMLGALVYVLANHRQAWHEKWIHDRYLAEHLRTSLYTLFVAPERPVEEVTHAAESLPFYAGPQTWLPGAIHHIVLAAREEMPATTEFESVRRFVVDGWLRDQRDWHAGNVKKKDRPHRRARRIVVALFGATFVGATLHVLEVAHLPALTRIAFVHDWLAYFAIILPAWGAGIHAIDKSLENERVASRSRQMSRVLENFVRRAERAANLDELREVVREAMFAVGLENYEWSVLLSFDPPELAA